jgi:hypothetical protein
MRAPPSPRQPHSPPLCRAALTSSPCRVTFRTAARECAVPIDACMPRPRRASPSLRPCAALLSPPRRAMSLLALQRVSVPRRSTPACPALAAPALSPPLCLATLTSFPRRVTSRTAAGECAVPIDACVPHPRRACPSLLPCAALPSPPPRAVSLSTLQPVSVPCRSTPACPALAAPAPLSAPVPRCPHLLPVPCHFSHCSK